MRTAFAQGRSLSCLAVCCAMLVASQAGGQDVSLPEQHIAPATVNTANNTVTPSSTQSQPGNTIEGQALPTQATEYSPQEEADNVARLHELLNS